MYGYYETRQRGHAYSTHSFASISDCVSSISIDWTSTRYGRRSCSWSQLNKIKYEYLYLSCSPLDRLSSHLTYGGFSHEYNNPSLPRAPTDSTTAVDTYSFDYRIKSSFHLSLDENSGFSLFKKHTRKKGGDHTERF